MLFRVGERNFKFFSSFQPEFSHSLAIEVNFLWKIVLDAQVGFLCDPRAKSAYSLFPSFDPLCRTFFSCEFWVSASISLQPERRRVCSINSWKNKAGLSICVVKQFLCHRKRRFLWLSCNFCVIFYSALGRIPLAARVTINWLCLCSYLGSEPANNEMKHQKRHNWQQQSEKPEAI